MENHLQIRFQYAIMFDEKVIEWIVIYQNMDVDSGSSS